jgi:DNA polymerase-4
MNWLYLDMNAFFASVEQEMNPHLRGKPIAVVPVLADTTCCIAVSYEAKSFGVKTVTKLREAKRLCPQIHFIEGRHDHYIHYHHKIVETVHSCLPVESICSIDEIACRLIGTQQNLEVAESLASQIKKEIRNKVGSSLRCSIGVAPNRYLAKIAADMQKPDGFTILRPCDLPKKLYPLSLRDLPGVGAQMEARLKEKHIYTLEQLCSLSSRQLREAWGSVVGEQIWGLLKGEELPEKTSEQKSISHSHVLPPELRYEQEALKVLKKLTTKAAFRLRKEQFVTTRIQIYVKFLNQESWKIHHGLPETQDTLILIHMVLQLWKKLPAGSPYAVGVALTGLIPEKGLSLSLFENHRRTKLIQTLDKVNEKFGNDSVHFGATHEIKAKIPLRVAFTRIPEIE